VRERVLGGDLVLGGDRVLGGDLVIGGDRGLAWGRGEILLSRTGDLLLRGDLTGGDRSLGGDLLYRRGDLLLSCFTGEILSVLTFPLVLSGGEVSFSGTETEEGVPSSSLIG